MTLLEIVLWITTAWILVNLARGALTLRELRSRIDDLDEVRVRLEVLHETSQAAIQAEVERLHRQAAKTQGPLR